MDHDETAATSPLVLRPLRRDDEAEATAAHREMTADGFTFLLHWHEGRDWDGYLAALERGARSGDPGEGGEGRETVQVALVEVLGSLAPCRHQRPQRCVSVRERHQRQR